MAKLNFQDDGTVQLNDGRTIRTVAAAPFSSTSRGGALPSRSDRDSRVDEALASHCRLSSESELANHLSLGLPVAMYGSAEGRLLDGTVAVTTTWWWVVAL